ncbi:MAG: hypothetical protein R6X02_00585 [Enhygromyxa sp.]
MLGLALALGCAPIDVSSQVTVRPREEPPRQFGAEQLASREFSAQYVQLGSRLLVELREHPSCVSVHHTPVMRVEEIRRSNRGFVAWDFVLGTASGAFAGLAFAKPQLFSNRLIDGQGRVVHETTSGYVIGGVFAVISAGLIAAGIVNSLRSRDTVRYAEAYEVELGPAHACGGEQAGAPVGERALRLIVAGEEELEGRSDDQGRARFELPSWARPIPASGRAPAVLEIARADGHDIEPRVLVLSLRVPYEGMVEAHTGFADTRSIAGLELAEPAVVESPVEGPDAPTLEPEEQP